MTKSLSVAQIICNKLLLEDTKFIFGIPGAAIVPLVSALSFYPEMQFILVRHEQQAAHAADGYSRETGKVGICLSTSGPGATNLITGIATAYYAFSPIIIFTGQVHSQVLGNKSIAQYIDIVKMTKEICKWSYCVKKPEEIFEVLDQAFKVALSGRQGPVLIDLPFDVQMALVKLPQNKPAYFSKSIVIMPELKSHEDNSTKAIRLINSSTKPIIVCGHGVISSGATDQLIRLAVNAKIPVCTTFGGIGGFPTENAWYIGIHGQNGFAHTNIAMYNADLVICLGASLNSRFTGNPKKFAPNAAIINIDLEPQTTFTDRNNTILIQGDIKQVLRLLTPQISSIQHFSNRTLWLGRIKSTETKYPVKLQINNAQHGITTPAIAEKFYSTQKEQLESGTIKVVISGPNCGWIWTKYARYHRPNTFFAPGGFCVLGFALPGATGIQFGSPDKKIWAIVGDGDFQMVSSTLSYIVEHNLPIRIGILNNGYLGTVRQFMKVGQNGYASKLSNPDFVALGKAYGMQSFRVTNAQELENIFGVVNDINGPCIIDFVTAPQEDCYPYFADLQSVEEMFVAYGVTLTEEEINLSL